MAAACFAGAILGQLTFGYIGDVIGRSKGLYLTQILSIIGAIGRYAFPTDSAIHSSAASFQWGPITPFMMVAFWRFILGVGVGGGYPLTAVLATESSHSQSKGFVGAFVFSMQGLAVVVSPLTMYILLLCFQNMEDPYAWVYRIALCICSFLPFPLRAYHLYLYKYNFPIKPNQPLYLRQCLFLHPPQSVPLLLLR